MLPRLPGAAFDKTRFEECQLWVLPKALPRQTTQKLLMFRFFRTFRQAGLVVNCGQEELSEAFDVQCMGVDMIAVSSERAICQVFQRLEVDRVGSLASWKGHSLERWGLQPCGWTGSLRVLGGVESLRGPGMVQGASFGTLRPISSRRAALLRGRVPPLQEIQLMLRSGSKVCPLCLKPLWLHQLQSLSVVGQVDEFGTCAKLSRAPICKRAPSKSECGPWLARQNILREPRVCFTLLCPGEVWAPLGL